VVSERIDALELLVTDLRAEMRAMRSTLDALLIARNHAPSDAPGLGNLLREATDPGDVDPEERKQIEADMAQFKKAWGQLYGDGVTDG
jgi:hypothetical protein